VRQLASACLGLLAALLGCSSSQQTLEERCPEGARQPLVNASASESYLGIAKSQERALVSIVDEAVQGAICSGAFVAGTWVLTAAHCDELSQASVLVAAGERTPSARLPVVRRALLGDDFGLFQVDFSSGIFGDEHPVPEAAGDNALDALAFDITPLEVPVRTLSRLEPGVAIELAGYGITETGAWGTLGFLVESIVGVTPSRIVVSGFGRSGACQGDSGGPLLMRDESGSLVVAGVLWGGSYTCLHEDEYVRTDVNPVQEWLRGVLEADAPSHGASSPVCGTITSVGRCLYGTALWCEGDTLETEPCVDGSVCGWSATDSAYRCVPPGAPCAGVDSIGECDGEYSVRCIAGSTRREACGPCGTCRVHAETGVPYCSADME
jgi:hypothetical protein